MAVTYVNASTGTADAAGAFTVTGMTPAQAGNIIILQILQDGTTDSAVTQTSATNITALAGTANTWTAIGQYQVGNAESGRQYLWVGRSTGTSAPTFTGGNSTSEDVFARMYEFSGVDANATTVAGILENATAGTIGSDFNTSTTCSDVSVQTTYAGGMALNFVALSDDAMGLAVFAGMTGGTWALSPDVYSDSAGTDGTIALMRAEMASAGTINGGSDTITSIGWGVIGFALIPELSPTVTLGTPADNATISDTTPDLTFTGTDLNGDTVDYQVQVDTQSDFHYVASGTAEYIFDSSDTATTDPNGVWTDEASAFDSDNLTTPTTFGYTTTAGSTSSNFILSEGTSAPANGGNITLVEVAIYPKISGGGTETGYAAIYTNGLGELLGTVTNTVSGWSAYTSLSVPSGGWGGTDWTKIQALECKGYVGSPMAGGTGIYAVKIRVTYGGYYSGGPLISALSTDHTGFSAGESHPTASGVEQTYTVQTSPNTYYFDGSDAAASDPNSVWTNDANVFDSDEETYATTSTTGTTSANFLLAEGTNAPVFGLTISSVEARIYSTISTTLQWSSYTTLTVPAGGWTWAKVAALEVKVYYFNAAGYIYPRATIYTDGLAESLGGSEGGGSISSGTIRVGKVEIRVNSTDQTLSPSTTYYWRVRAIDPSGSNTWGVWSSVNDFTILGAVSNANSAKANIVQIISGNTNSTKANILTTVSSNTNSAKAGLVVSNPQDQSVKENIVATLSKDTSAKGSIIVANQSPISVKADILVNDNTKAISTKASIVAQTAGGNNSKANILGTLTQGQNAKANIKVADNVADNSVKADILRSPTQGLSVKGNILKIDNASDTSTKASILITVLNGNSTKANVLATSLKDNVVIGSIFSSGQIQNSSRANILQANLVTDNSAKANVVQTVIQPPSQTWYNSSWANRVKITVLATQVPVEEPQQGSTGAGFGFGEWTGVRYRGQTFPVENAGNLTKIAFDRDKGSKGVKVYVDNAGSDDKPVHAIGSELYSWTITNANLIEDYGEYTLPTPLAVTKGNYCFYLASWNTDTDAYADDYADCHGINPGKKEITNNNGTWALENLTHHYKVTIEGATQADYPVYVDLSTLPAEFHTNVNQTDGRDIRVTTSDEVTEIPREVVWYTAASDTGEMYFKGTVNCDTNTDFYIYYGNASATEPAVSSDYGRNNVWTSYRVVYHMADVDTSTILDSTGNFNGTKTGANTPAETASGKFGKGQEFSGAMKVDIADSIDQTELSYTAWLKTDVTNNQQYVIHRAKSDNPGIVYDLFRQYLSMYECYTVDGGGPDIAGGTVTTAWTHIGFTVRNNDFMDDYVNGASVATRTYVGTRDTTGDMYKLSVISAPFDGIMDEVRIAGIKFSSAWIAMEYANQSSPATFYEVGAQEVSIGGVYSAKANIQRTETAALSVKADILQTLFTYTQENFAKASILNLRTQNVSARGAIVTTPSNNNSSLANIQNYSVWGSSSKASLRVTNASGVSVKASIVRTESDGQSGLANIKATLSKNNSALASIKTQGQAAFSARANIKRTDEVAGTSAKASVYRTETAGLSAKASLVVTSVAGFLSRADILASVSQSVSSKADIKRTNSEGESSRANILSTSSGNTNSVKASLFLLNQSSGVSARANLFLQNLTVNNFAKASLVTTNSQNSSVKADILVSNNLKANSSRANIITPNLTKNNSAKASLVVSNTQSLSVKGNIKATLSKDGSSKGSIQSSGQSPMAAMANVLRINESKNLPVKSNIVTPNLTNANSAKASLLIKDSLSANSSRASIQTTTVFGNQTKADLKNTYSQNLSIKANIPGAVSGSAKSNIKATTSQENSVAASINVSGTVISYSKANIKASVASGQSSRASIQNTVSSALSARANILTRNNLANTSAKANILVSGNTGSNQTKASLVTTNSSGVNAKADIKTTLVKDAVSLASINVSGTGVSYAKANIHAFNLTAGTRAKANIIIFSTANNSAKAAILIRGLFENSAKGDISATSVWGNAVLASLTSFNINANLSRANILTRDLINGIFVKSNLLRIETQASLAKANINITEVNGNSAKSSIVTTVESGNSAKAYIIGLTENRVFSLANIFVSGITQNNFAKASILTTAISNSNSARGYLSREPIYKPRPYRTKENQIYKHGNLVYNRTTDVYSPMSTVYDRLRTRRRG